MTDYAPLKAIVGPRGFSEDPADIAPHLEEWRGKFHGRSSLLLKPANVAEIAALLAHCNNHHIPIVAQGGNTGLVGGQIPFHGEVILSLSRLNKIRSVDADGMSLIAEPGVTLASIQSAADDADRLFPLSLASEGSCTIGGNISTNAGGVDVLRYGPARDLVLGLEVVLPNGEVLNLLRTLRKDNTGYDLKQLFIGAEGTLGIVTAAALKLFVKPAHRVTAFAAIPDPAHAVKLLASLQSATGGQISAFELMPHIGLDFVLRHIPQTSSPLQAVSPWYVLIEATGPDSSLTDQVQKALLAAADDAVLAQSRQQSAALWRLRDAMSEAQKYEGGSIKHDISVPVAALPAFLEKASAAVLNKIPGARPVPFGHLGDGNIHFNITVPKGANNADFLARWADISQCVHDIVHDFGGSISAEHGLGVLKNNEIARYKSAVEIETMRGLKRLFDPNNILNPGKLLPDL